MPQRDIDLFEEQVGVLTFKAEPIDIGLEKFTAAVERLVSGRAPAPAIDITCTNFIPSKYLAIIMKAAANCRVNGKEMTLMAQPNVAKLFDRAGFTGLGRIGTAGE